MTASETGQPLLPDYANACISNIVPALLEHPDAGGDWMPEAATRAKQVVLLVLDGLGWEQLQERRSLTPTLSAMTGGSIVTVAPSTTSSALTSIVTGTPPGEHGIIGYRMYIDGEVLNVLRWATPAGDARKRIVPEDVQKISPFLGRRPPVVSRAEFAGSGFTRAHLVDVRLVGYRMLSSLVVDVGRLVRDGEPFVYAYYDGLDKVAHEYGLGEHFDAEIAAVDRLVADVLAALPSGTVLVVTADHGQVHVGANVIELAPEVLAGVSVQSGEGRFRWLHTRPGHYADVLAAATDAYGEIAWIRGREQVLDEGWFGPTVSADSLARLGDIALVPQGKSAFVEPTDSGPLKLIGRHGGLTPTEMLVPLLVGSA